MGPKALGTARAAQCDHVTFEEFIWNGKLDGGTLNDLVLSFLSAQQSSGQVDGIRPAEADSFPISVRVWPRYEIK